MGFVTPLVRLVYMTKAEHQVKQLNQLISKAESAAGVEELLQQHPDCLKTVVKYLCSSSVELWEIGTSTGVEVWEKAARVLGRVAQAGPTYQRQVLHCKGAVARLVDLLQMDVRPGYAALPREASLALGNLVRSYPEAQDRLCQEPGAISRLAALLESSKADVQLAAAFAVAALMAGSPAISQRIGKGPGVIEGLAVLLERGEAEAQALAAAALGNLALGSFANIERIRRVPGITDRLVKLLSSDDAAVQFEAAFVVAAAAEFSSVFQQVLEAHSAAVATALYNQLDSQTTARLLEVSLQLHRLAAVSPALRQSMAGSQEVMQLVVGLEERLRGTPDNKASATLELLTSGDTATPAAPYQSSTAPRGPSSNMVTTGGTAGAALAQGAAPLPHSAQDAAAAHDQTSKASIRASAKLATTVELLGMLESYAKDVPFLSACIKPLTGFLDRVEQVCVNKEKARYMKSRVDALMRFLACMFSSKEQWQGALDEVTQKLLEQQLTRLGNALWQATGLIAKWSETMLLGAAVRFLKADLDKEDIKDFENTVNKAMQDLNFAVASLNLIHTLEVQQQLQLLSQAASASQELELAHQRDLQQLQDHLEQLLGGQAELQQQLAAATEEQRQEWERLAGSLGQVAGDDAGLRGELRELADMVRAIEEQMKQQHKVAAV